MNKSKNKTVSQANISLEPGDCTRYDFIIIGKAIVFKNNYIANWNFHNIMFDFACDKWVTEAVLGVVNNLDVSYICNLHKKYHPNSTLKEEMDELKEILQGETK